MQVSEFTMNHIQTISGAIFHWSPGSEMTDAQRQLEVEGSDVQLVAVKAMISAAHAGVDVTSWKLSDFKQSTDDSAGLEK